MIFRPFTKKQWRSNSFQRFENSIYVYRVQKRNNANAGDIGLDDFEEIQENPLELAIQTK